MSTIDNEGCHTVKELDRTPTLSKSDLQSDVCSDKSIIMSRNERRYKMSKMGWFGAVRVIQGHWN